ncbi:hypothetical protein MIND_01349700 [Mycena indigotica]|uniref:DUF6533 domain-containing protein n=1 Tax=Mycena indigotica TaxID=2126181 RepID=A0A8H6RXU6_9AGAR|nr:uncharacterized protein MIND_01349700 [Mycena indigotica]KAF7289760.1 hypothetical protein MIND_01349700 [Mycena indigotica]
MAADGDGSHQFDAVTIAFDLRMHNYLALPAMTFLFWDHALTFGVLLPLPRPPHAHYQHATGDEIRFLWRRKKTMSTYCFFLNRYIAFFGDIAVIYFTFYSIPAEECRSVNFFRQILLIVNQSLICMLLTLRIYALYGRESKLWMYLVAAACGLLGLGLWGISGRHSYPLPDVEGCHLGNSFDTGVHLAVPWLALFTYDCMIAVSLFWKSFSAMKSSGGRDMTLLTLLVRDGAMYFVAMASANLGNILTFYLCDDLLRGSLSTLASCLSVTMMSRLMLNLHAVESKGIFSTIATVQYYRKHANAHSTTDGEWSPVVELDTLWTRDMERSAYILSQSDETMSR